MNASEIETEDTNLSNEDHERFFELDSKTYLTIFGVIFLITASFFYWFSYTMENNAHKKVLQAKKILARANEAPDTINPLTLELESMVHETEQERNWILDELTADSFTKHFNNELEERYLNATARLRLPSDWKQRLPRNIRQWASQQRQQRMRSVEAFYNRLDETLLEIEGRLERLETIRDSEAIQPGEFGGSVRRYLSVKSTVKSRVNQLQDELDQVNQARLRLSNDVFQTALRLIDPMTKLALHIRGFSALTAGPAAYYHAERLLYDALRIDPKDPEAYYYLGEVYRKLNMGPVASEHKLRALKWDPSYKRETILSTFRNRLKEKPGDSRRRYDLAWALYEVGKINEAKKHFQQILSQERGRNSMVRVLAQKRLSYILNGEPPYNKLTNF